MPYLPLPRTAVPVVAMATLVLVAWVGWGSIRDPETMWAPGDLSRYHADVARCASCHEPFRGPASVKCIGCHSETLFAERSKPAVGTFHREVIKQQKTCLACHTEHRGALAQITASAMFNPHGEFISAQREPAHAVPVTSSVQRSAPAPPCSTTTRSTVY